MSTVFDCHDQNCMEALAETAIAGFASVLYIQGFRRIIRDRNNLLNKVNKIIYGLGMAQIIILSLYFSFWGSDLMISTIRCLRLVSEATLCSVLSEIVFEEEHFTTIQKVLKIVLVFVFVEWFWTAIINQSIYDYFCLQMDYLVLSSSTLILTLFAAYLGITALQLLRSFQEEANTIEKENQAENAFDEMKSRAFQIKLLLGADCLSSFIQFIWDYIAFTNATSLKQCKYYYEAESFIGIFVFTILKFLTLMLSPLAVYYVFYYKYQNQFNTSTAKELDMGVFFDARSQLVRESTHSLSKYNNF